MLSAARFQPTEAKSGIETRTGLGFEQGIDCVQTEALCLNALVPICSHWQTLCEVGEGYGDGEGNQERQVKVEKPAS